MLDPKKYKEVKSPRITARYLADYMAGSERAKRSIVASCKYPPMARLVQHNDAKAIISNWERGGRPEGHLQERAESLREKFAHDDFDRDLYDHNADYLDRYAVTSAKITLPKADLLPPQKFDALVLNGVNVAFDPNLLFQRMTKTNVVKIGAGMLRYEKGKPLKPAAGAWQSAFIHGYMRQWGAPQGAEAELRLCVTIDGWTGETYLAPTDAVTRFKNMEAACKTIAEWWPNIAPPLAEAA